MLPSNNAPSYLSFTISQIDGIVLRFDLKDLTMDDVEFFNSYWSFIVDPRFDATMFLQMQHDHWQVCLRYHTWEKFK
jgi:hypothetical protein